MLRINHFVSLLLLCTASPLFAQTGSWPQASGPNFNWQVDATEVPTSFSGSLDENIVWKTTLPEGGQSTVAIANGRVFVSTNEPWPENSSEKPQGSNVVGYCLDAKTGKLLWNVKLPGVRPMKYAGIFSDSTSPSPVTDGEHVWFFNASGNMGCLDMNGKQIWIRPFQPRMRHHSRQCEPILFGDVILYVEVIDKELARSTAMHKAFPKDVDVKRLWTHIHAIDRKTGKIAWIVEDATAIHNTPMIGKLRDGSFAVLHGRGGGHEPPEKPYGISLSSLKDGQLGKTLWNSDATSMSYLNSHFNESIVAWFNKKEHLVFDVTSGRLLKTQPLLENASIRYFDSDSKSYKDGGHRELKRVLKGKITHER